MGVRPAATANFPRTRFWRAIMTYVRMYETEQQARAAITKLKKGGFPENAMHLVTPGANGDALLGYMIGSDTRVYAENLALGRSFVLVRAPFRSPDLQDFNMTLVRENVAPMYGRRGGR